MPAEAESNASSMVVSVKTVITNDAPFEATVRVEQPLPSGASYIGSTLMPASTSPPTWELELDAAEARELILVMRLPDDAAPATHEVESTLSVLESETPVEVEEQSVEYDVSEDRDSARDALEYALDDLEAAVEDETDGDVAKVEAVRDHLTAADTLIGSYDPEAATAAEDAKAIYDELIDGYADVITVSEPPAIDDTCRELTRLIRYWGWEYTVRSE